MDWIRGFEHHCKTRGGWSLFLYVCMHLFKNACRQGKKRGKRKKGDAESRMSTIAQSNACIRGTVTSRSISIRIPSPQISRL